MAPDLELYRGQHRALLDAARALEGLLERQGEGSGPQARALLARLGGKLTVHLQMEDRQLYPELLASPSEDVRRTAARFLEEMGSLRETADAFLRRWLPGGAIEAARETFAAEARPVLRALAARVDAEDRVLYPLAERAP